METEAGLMRVVRERGRGPLAEGTAWAKGLWAGCLLEDWRAGPAGQ